jgi:hypothetical protein
MWLPLHCVKGSMVFREWDTPISVVWEIYVRSKDRSPGSLYFLSLLSLLSPLILASPM